MSVVIKELHRMDGYHDRHFGTIAHNGHLLGAVIVGPFEQLLSLLHLDVGVEYELNEIISVDANLPKDDSLSGIYQLEDRRVAVDGTIHNETEIDEHLSVIDIYIQNGADFWPCPRTISNNVLRWAQESGSLVRDFTCIPHSRRVLAP